MQRFCVVQLESTLSNAAVECGAGAQPRANPTRSAARPPGSQHPLTEATPVHSARESGDGRAAAELLPVVYAELRRLAAAQMARERPGHTLQPTALVHEAYLRLVAQGETARFAGPTHFFGAAAEAMRRILIDRARRRLAAKRGGGAAVVDLDDLEVASPAADDDQLLAVNEAIEKLAAVDARKAELVRLRYFIGLSFEETAAALGIAVPTAKQWWAYARAWLMVELRGFAPR